MENAGPTALNARWTLFVVGCLIILHIIDMGRGLCFHPMTLRYSIVIENGVHARAGWRRSFNVVGSVLIGKLTHWRQVVDIFSHTYNWLKIFCRHKLCEMRTRLSANESVAYSTINGVPIGVIACWSNEGNHLLFVTNKFDACWQSRITSQYHESLVNILWIVSIERINSSIVLCRRLILRLRY